MSGLSEWATKTYELTLQPLIAAMVTPTSAQARRDFHPLRLQQHFFSHKNPLFTNLDEMSSAVRARRAPAAKDNVFVRLESAQADLTEHGWNLYRDMRDAAIEITFHSLYGTPWMRRLGAARRARPRSHDISKFPHVQQAIRKARMGGYAEGVIRMLILLARARGSVRRDRLERSDKLLHSRPPFNSMTPEVRSHMIYEQSLIVQFAGNEAITTLADLLNDPVDRYRSLNLVLDVAGPVEDMDAPTTAMFMRFQRALLTLAREWRDLGLERRLAAGADSRRAPRRRRRAPATGSRGAAIDRPAQAERSRHVIDAISRSPAAERSRRSRVRRSG